jgi:large subunit ribosomal protein L17
MRHSVFGRKFSRTKNERKRLLQGLVRDLLIHGTIKTSLPKAKASQPMIEKLITKAKDGSRASLNQIEKVLASKDIENALIADAKTRFGSRSSGFTRIIHLGKRLGDSTEEVLFQLVDEKVIAEVVKPKTAKTEAAKEEVKKPVKKTVKKVSKK